MNLKYVILIFVLTVVGLMAIYPGVLLVPAIVISSVMSSVNSVKSIETTGKNVVIKKTEVPYTDWNTGMNRTRVEKTIESKNKKLTLDAIQELVNQKHPNLLEYPTIYDSVELSSDDVLLSVSRNSQGAPYPVIRVQSSTDSKFKADLIEVGDVGAAYNWFLPSRIEGWVRVLGGDNENYYIKKKPFQVVRVGKGNVVKAIETKLLIADENEKTIQLRAFDLNLKKNLANLTLDKTCFRLPTFSFDHPKIENDSATYDNKEIFFKQGPEWWDRNFELINFNNTIQLKKNHELKAPPQKIVMVERGLYVHKKNDSAEDEVDQIIAESSDCSKINSKGLALAKTSYPEQVAAHPTDICLLNLELISESKRAEICKDITRREVFSSGKVKLFETSFVYISHTSKKNYKYVQPELEIGDIKYAYIQNSENAYDNLLIHSYTKLNQDNLLLQVRDRSGPWYLYLVRNNNSQYEISKLEQYGYPGSDTEELSDKNYLYNRDARLLVRKNPLRIWHGANNVVTVKEEILFSLFPNYQDDQYKIGSWDLNQDSTFEYGFGSESFIGKNVDKNCKNFPAINDSMQVKEKWFMDHVIFSKTKKSINFKCKK